MLHRRMQLGCEAKANPQQVKATLHDVRRRLDVDPQLHQHVGGPALTGDFAIAMFGDAGASGGGDNRGRGADIEGAGSVAASSTGIDQIFAATTDGRHMATHGPRRPRDLVDRFALGVQPGEQQRNPRRWYAPGHDRVDHVVHFVQREILTGCNATECGVVHGNLLGGFPVAPIGLVSQANLFLRRAQPAAGRQQPIVAVFSVLFAGGRERRIGRYGQEGNYRL